MGRAPTSRGALDRLGLGFLATVLGTMAHEDRDTIAAFEDARGGVAAITSAQRLFGETLAGLPGIQLLTSTLVMRDVVPARGLPI